MLGNLNTFEALLKIEDTDISTKLVSVKCKFMGGANSVQKTDRNRVVENREPSFPLIHTNSPQEFGRSEVDAGRPAYFDGPRRNSLGRLPP